ncbi:MAG: putative C-S lyase [Betaproteobacteria bacterium]|nr:putative C-S lyase [Betaproteobacteria bacterium]
MSTRPEFDFDTIVDRGGTWSLKWDRYRGRDVIPMWVADMDFRSAPAIVDALRRRVDHGVFGYVEPGPELVEAIVARLQAAYGWTPDPDWFVWVPGLVSGLNIVARAVGEPGDDIVTATPIYPPFLSAPGNARRGCVRVPLVEENGRASFSAAVLERALTPASRLLLLCNPHNPVGRVYSREELHGLADVCLRRNLVVCSDEIHCGLVLDPDRKHVPIASLSPEIAAKTVTLMAASKTFNLPGLGTAFAIVADASLRRRIADVMRGIVHRPMTIGLWATLAAYRDGEPWRLALIDYLRANLALVERRIGALPGFRVHHAEATYLAWIDCRGSGIENCARFFESAGVGLYDGADFGAPGFLRLNFGCPRSVLENALERMERAVLSPA